MRCRQRQCWTIPNGWWICARLDIRGRSFHSLRHAVASQQYHAIDKDALAKRLAENLSLTQITQLLGHSNPRTAKGYVH